MFGLGCCKDILDVKVADLGPYFDLLAILLFSDKGF